MAETNPPDVEKGLPNRTIRVGRGFPDLVRSFTCDEDDETFVFRKFRGLGLQTLLYLQSEVMVLEGRLETLEKEMMASQDPLDRWALLGAEAAGKGEKGKKRMKLMDEARNRLKEYHEAMIRQKEISKMARPEKRVLDTLRRWMNLPDHNGHCQRRILGIANTYLDNAQDLAALSPARDKDGLSTLVRKIWRPGKKDDTYTDPTDTIAIYRGSDVSRWVLVVDVIIAAILLIAPITSLHFVKPIGWVLGIIAAFITLFIAAMALMTNARRSETFVSAAVYAAVMVVFASK